MSRTLALSLMAVLGLSVDAGDDTLYLDFCWQDSQRSVSYSISLLARKPAHFTEGKVCYYHGTKTAICMEVR